MRDRLISQALRFSLDVMVTHEYKLDNIVEAYELFSHQRDGVLKIAIKPWRAFEVAGKRGFSVTVQRL